MITDTRVNPAPGDSEAVRQQRDYEASPDHTISVATELAGSHKLVRRTRSVLRRGKAWRRGLLEPREYPCLTISVTRGSLDRALRIAEALVAALEQRGMPVIAKAEGPYATVATVLGEEVSFRIEERVRQVQPPPAPKGPWPDLSSRSQPTSEPTGLLILRMVDLPYGFQGRQSWSDGKRQRVEECLHDFVIGLVQAAEALKAARRDRERVAEELREAERQRAIAHERREREKDRRQELEREIKAWRWAEEVRQYHAALSAAVHEADGRLDPNGRVVKWLRWIESYMNHIDPLRNLDHLPYDPEGWAVRPLDLDQWQLDASRRPT